MKPVSKTVKQGKEEKLSAWIEAPGEQIDFRARWLMASGALMALDRKDLVEAIERDYPEPVTLKYTNPEFP